MKNVERKWWYVAASAFLSTVITISLLRAAGIWPTTGVAQWIVYFICFVGVWRCIGFVSWFVILFTTPSSKLLDR